MILLTNATKTIDTTKVLTNATLLVLIELIYQQYLVAKISPIISLICFMMC